MNTPENPAGTLLAASPWFPLSPEKMAELQKHVMDVGTPKTETEWWARREIVDLLEFVREQVEQWDNDGDCGFPLYEHGKRIMGRHAALTPNMKTKSEPNVTEEPKSAARGSVQSVVRPTGPQDVGYWWTRPADDCLWRIVEITYVEHTMLIQEMGDEETAIFIEMPHWQWRGPIAPPS